MNIKLRGRLTGDERVLAGVFVGKDADHYQLAGELTLDVSEWHFFAAALLLGAARTDGGLQVEVEDPPEEAAGSPAALAEALAAMTTLGYREHDPANPARVPAELRESIDRYVSSGVPLGGFLQSVIANDFVDAHARADAFNMRVLPAIAAFVHWKLPETCWGSRRVYAAWLELHAAERARARASEKGDLDAMAAALARQERAEAEVSAAWRASREARLPVEA